MVDNDNPVSGDSPEMVTDKPWDHLLNDRQRQFVIEYCKDFNGARAARESGYEENSARQIAYENLTKLYIQDAVDAYLDIRSMKTTEAIDKLTTWGRGTLAPFIFNGELDLDSPTARDHVGLLKEVEQTKTTRSGEDFVTETVRTKIKIHDPLAATVKILEVRGKLINKNEHTFKGKPDWLGIAATKPNEPL